MDLRSCFKKFWSPRDDPCSRDLIHYFFKSNGENISLLDERHSRIALQFACEYNFLPMLKLLVDKGVTCSELLSSRHCLPVIAALKSKSTECVIYLLKYGKGIKLKTPTGEISDIFYNSMSMAIHKRNTDVVEFLLDNLDATSLSFFHFCNHCGWLSRAMQAMMPIKPFLMHWQGKHSWLSGSLSDNTRSPFVELIDRFIMKSYENNDYILQCIDDLKSAGFGTRWGKTQDAVLPFSVLAGYPEYAAWREVADKLIEVGFNPFEVDENGSSAIHIAILHGHYELVDYLSNINPISISSIGFNEYTPSISLSAFSNKHL
jgi:ankyrin repeat protein